jgi:hypothetical protein
MTQKPLGQSLWSSFVIDPFETDSLPIPTWSAVGRFYWIQPMYNNSEGCWTSMALKIRKERVCPRPGVREANYTAMNMHIINHQALQWAIIHQPVANWCARSFATGGRRYSADYHILHWATSGLTATGSAASGPLIIVSWVDGGRW